LGDREGNREGQAANEHLTEISGGAAGEGGRAEFQQGADDDGTGVRDGKGGVGLDTEVTARDEGAGNGQNLRGREGDVERLRDGRAALEDVQHGLVARLDGEDGSGAREDARVIDEMRSAKVGADADVLDDARE